MCCHKLSSPEANKRSLGGKMFATDDPLWREGGGSKLGKKVKFYNLGRTQRGWFISAGEASLTRRASWCSWCYGSHLWKIEFPMKILLQTNHCYTFNKEPNSFVILFLNIIIFIIFKSLDSNSQWLELAFCMCLLWLGVISFSWLGCHRKEIKKDTGHSTQFEEHCWMHWSQPPISAEMEKGSAACGVPASPSLHRTTRMYQELWEQKTMWSRQSGVFISLFVSSGCH